MNGPQKFETSRLAGLSDGIFAIGVTLLVLGLKLPEAPDEKLTAALQSTMTKLEVWVVSYLVIGSLWILQHNIFARLKYVDTPLLLLNLLFLMCVSLLPWTTDLVGIYENEPLAIVIFSGSLGLAGLFLMVGCIYSFKFGRLCAPDLDERKDVAITLLAARIPVVATIAIALAFVHRGPRCGVGF